VYRNHQRKLTAAQQYYILKNSIACPGSGKLHRYRFVWEFEARPTLLSRVYDLRLTYKQADLTPQVLVVKPDLTVLAEGRKLPHVYQQRPTRLCLYMPRTGEWNPEKSIAATIIPWTVLWLFYFEEWILSNDWKGRGFHPEEDDGTRL
jgi:hypothetical protein